MSLRGRGRGGLFTQRNSAFGSRNRRRRRDSSSDSDGDKNDKKIGKDGKKKSAKKRLGEKGGPDYGGNANCIPLGTPGGGAGPGGKKKKLGIGEDGTPYFFTDGGRKMKIDEDLGE